MTIGEKPNKKNILITFFLAQHKCCLSDKMPENKKYCQLNKKGQIIGYKVFQKPFSFTVPLKYLSVLKSFVLLISEWEKVS